MYDLDQQNHVLRHLYSTTDASKASSYKKWRGRNSVEFVVSVLSPSGVSKKFPSGSEAVYFPESLQKTVFFNFGQICVKFSEHTKLLKVILKKVFGPWNHGGQAWALEGFFCQSIFYWSFGQRGRVISFRKGKDKTKKCLSRILFLAHDPRKLGWAGEGTKIIEFEYFS